MTFRSQTGRKGTGRQPSKTTREKKSKEKKQKTAKYLQEETPEVSAKQVAERTLGGINRLGNQIFALSPFSQYFDDWLVNLGQVVSEFESNPTISVDEQFQKTRAQVFSDVEAALAEDRLAESTLTEEAKALEENNHKIADADKEYAEKTRDLSNRRNTELQRLSTTVRELEDDLASAARCKNWFLQIQRKTWSRREISANHPEAQSHQERVGDFSGKL